MKPLGEKSKFQVLSDAELTLVSGGLDDNDLPEVVVIGKPMTPAEMAVYDGWNFRAQLETDFIRYAGFGALGALGAGAGIWGTVGATLGAVGWDDFWSNRDAIINGVADEYYRADAADGSVDGQIWGDTPAP